MVTTRIRLGPQVLDFIAQLSPEPKRALRQALKGIAVGAGDIKQLEGKLIGFSRVRSGRIRVIFQERGIHGERHIFCFFADYRASIYEAFEQLLASDLLEKFSE